MHILISNDDGIYSPGLKALAEVADDFGEVRVVAPDVDVKLFREQMLQMGQPRPRFVLFLSRDDRALKLSQSLWGGAPRLGEIDPRDEPYKSELQREQIMVFDVTYLQGDPHSRTFDDVKSVMGMIERRLAQGQQLDEDPTRSVPATQ